MSDRLVEIKKWLDDDGENPRDDDSLFTFSALYWLVTEVERLREIEFRMQRLEK